MGSYLRETAINVALVGLDSPIAARVAGRFLTLKSGEDLGTFQVRQFADIATCKNELDSFKTNAVCIQLSRFPAADTSRFIADTRETHPHVAFCLVGTHAYLQTLGGFAPDFRERFKHYFRMHTDLDAADFENEAGLVRDLFVADSVKCRALGVYLTTPGKVVKLRGAAPYGARLAVFAGLAGTVLGSTISPLVTYLLPEKPSLARAAPAPTSGQENTARLTAHPDGSVEKP